MGQWSTCRNGRDMHNTYVHSGLSSHACVGHTCEAHGTKFQWTQDAGETRETREYKASIQRVSSPISRSSSIPGCHPSHSSQKLLPNAEGRHCQSRKHTENKELILSSLCQPNTHAEDDDEDGKIMVARVPLPFSPSLLISKPGREC